VRIFINTAFLTIAFAIAFFSVALIFPGPDVEPLYAGAAAGIFGIFIGFSISGANRRISRVNELVKDENGINLTHYNMSALFGKKIQNEVRALIDNYLIAQVDYKLEDFHRSSLEFKVLHTYLLNLKFDTKKEEKAYSEIISNLNKQTLNRSQIEASVGERISRYEWMSILFLLMLVVFTSYNMSDGTVLRAIFVTILATASILLVLVLRDINNLKWNKNFWTWQPLKNLFLNLGLVPYFPGYNLHEIKFKKGEEFRIGILPNKYPDLSGRRIELREFGVKRNRITKAE
jgi:hypothetical protein